MYSLFSWGVKIVVILKLEEPEISFHALHPCRTVFVNTSSGPLMICHEVRCSSVEPSLLKLSMSMSSAYSPKGEQTNRFSCTLHGTTRYGLKTPQRGKKREEVNIDAHFVSSQLVDHITALSYGVVSWIPVYAP